MDRTELVLAVASRLPRAKALLRPPNPAAQRWPSNIDDVLAYIASLPKIDTCAEFAAIAATLPYSQGELADRLGVHRTTVSAWLAAAAGRSRAQPARPPTAAHIAALKALK